MNCLSTDSSLKARLGIKTASSQADSKMVATVVLPCNGRIQAFDSGGSQPNLPSPTIHSDSEGDEITLKS